MVLTNAQWAKYKAAIGNAMGDFANKPIIWRRKILGVDRWGEDTANSTTQDVTIVGLFTYNIMRSWPITFTSESGELDRQSAQLYLDIPYLKANGYWTATGNFDYNPDYDRFIIDGLVYKSFGDTPASQAREEDLLFTLIIKREETPTSEKVRP